MEAFTPALREKMMRLEKENQILRRRVETAESASSEPGMHRKYRGIWWNLVVVFFADYLKFCPPKILHFSRLPKEQFFPHNHWCLEITTG